MIPDASAGGVLHVVALPHTEITDSYSWCAYTQKVRGFCRMMLDKGYSVILYSAGKRCQAPYTERMICNLDLPPNGVLPDFEATDPLFARFNQNAVTKMKKKIKKRDIICLIAGKAQSTIAEAFTNHLVVEFGIGYGGVIPSTHHVYESYAWMHMVYGAQTGGDPHQADGRFYDAVIPNFYDPNMFPRGNGSGGYLLYMGRLIERKGLQVAIDTARQTGLPLKVAGAGDYKLPNDVEHVGLVRPPERAKLMGEAVALMAPTLYVEPFGGVAVEAQLCGTPAITTDWGAFTETVEQGVTGFRCRNLAEFVDAAHQAHSLNRQKIRKQAIATWSIGVVAERYDAYFQRLQTLWGQGFYEMPASPA